MKTITVTIEVYDNSSVEDIERAVSAGLDSNGIDCTYNIKEIVCKEVCMYKKIYILKKYKGCIPDFIIKDLEEYINKKEMLNGNKIVKLVNRNKKISLNIENRTIRQYDKNVDIKDCILHVVDCNTFFNLVVY